MGKRVSTYQFTVIDLRYGDLLRGALRTQEFGVRTMTKLMIGAAIVDVQTRFLASARLPKMRMQEFEYDLLHQGTFFPVLRLVKAVVLRAGKD
jgi:hypothetical protein